MTVEEYLQKLTLAEKVSLLQGSSSWTTSAVPRVLLKSIFLADGPHGLRKQAGSADHLGLNESIPATCFPTAATMANSWDPDLGQQIGRALGREAAASGVHVVLGPGLNIKRSPLCGRNFEYFSEDPYLSGKMAAAYIRGIQENGTAACPKHFAANSQELHRMSTDSVMDERTLREIYLTGFEIAVKEGHPKAIMASYNRLNGTYAYENPHLLQQILRKEWGFDGFVVSDWGACNDPAAATAAGGNLNMPNPGFDCAQYVCDAIAGGQLSEQDVDDRLRELLPVILECLERPAGSFDQDAHHALAQKCAEQSVVLLENDGILPLRSGAKIALIGEFAQKPRYQGAGSSQVNPTRVDNLVDAMTATGMDVTYAQGYARFSAPDRELTKQALAAAKSADVVLLCVGLDELSETEGRDRANLNLPDNQLALIRAVSKVNSNVVLVLFGGAPFLMPRSDYFRAAVHGYLGGQAGATAMANVLTGKVNPSGHLSESWPLALEDTPCHRYYPGTGTTVEYREGLFVGYRYYCGANVSVRYPFGHGLSYTKFAYSDISASNNAVSFTLTNTGYRDGAEVAQIYISSRTGNVFRTGRELKAFQKVFLRSGESRRVTIPLDDKAFRFFDPIADRFRIETAHYVIEVGSSATDIRLSTTLRILGDSIPNPYPSLPSYEKAAVAEISDEEFAALLGRPIPDSAWADEIQINDPIDRFAHAQNPAARFLCRTLQKRLAQNAGKPEITELFILNMPIRAMAQMTKGLITRQMTEDIVYWANGHFWSGSFRLLLGFFRGRKAADRYQQILDYGPEDK